MRRLKWLSVIYLLIFIFICSPAVMAENAQEEWMPYVFSLQSNAQDWNRIIDPSNFNKDTVEYLLKEEGYSYTYEEITFDYSQAYTIYEYYDVGLISNIQSSWEEQDIFYFSVDGIPYMNGQRYVCIPMYVEERLIGIATLADWVNGDPNRMTPHHPSGEYPSGGDGYDLGPSEIGGGIRFIDGSDWEPDWKYAPEAYAAAKEMGLKVRNIVVDFNPICFIVTDNEYDLHIYDAVDKKIYTFGEFIQMCRDGSWPHHSPISTSAVSSSSTRTPFWTPRPSGTASISAPNTQTIATPTFSKTPTATPSAGETAAPVLTATASLFPSSSSAPEQNTGSTVLIVIGGVLVVAAAGAVGWAVFRKKKGKE